ncbi:hypothetical protein G4Y79_22935 [Phototrophicus methaneseepsis]|uniref:Uncharacterized protein n=1 Tax=Phototrophicus methaneseepsis TaxID=2710758 RepID=A0A7S8E8V3_9CHLR|nr:hypothetical protein [Phototrophicus methaneseepsis]QPC82506.1 hypothetical protein G4Y79_22935 [Phototrophicus methaneseepsis]
MQKRHFLVRANADGGYRLREVSADVARGVHQFVTTVGRCQPSTDREWIFYFMHMTISRQRANEIASELVHEVCDEQPADCAELKSTDKST